MKCAKKAEPSADIKTESTLHQDYTTLDRDLGLEMKIIAITLLKNVSFAVFVTLLGIFK